MFLNQVVSKVHGVGVNQLKIIRRFAKFHPDPYKSPEQLQIEEEESGIERPRRKLKNWRNLPGNIGQDSGSFFGMFNKQADRDDAGGFIFRGKSLKPSDFSRWRDLKLHEYLQYDQKFLPDRNQALGNDLAAVHFIVFRNGRVRRKGETEFLTSENIDIIPDKFRTDWHLEEIDLSNTEIMYEGLENFKNLKWLKRATFKNCRRIDDWCMDRIIGLCPSLEYLDVSLCENITERGLESLYKAWNLKEFIISDYFHSPAFELTCLMIEDCMPQMKIHIQKMPKVELSPPIEDYKEPDEEQKVRENKN